MGQIRKIRTTDTWWQRCVDLLSASCEVILVDLSVVKSGSRWELSKIAQEKLHNKTIFIVHRDKLENAESVMAEYWNMGERPPILCYDESGKIADKTSFEKRIAEILSATRPVFAGVASKSYWYFISMFSWLIPLVGLAPPIILWDRASRSDGRLRGHRLGQISLILGLVVSIVSYPLARWLSVIR